MKKVLFSLLLVVMTATGYSQASCPQVTAPTVTEIAPDVFLLNLIYSANGTKHIKVRVYTGPVGPSTLLIDTCFAIQGTGTLNYTYTNTAATNIVVLTTGTGNCNNGNGNTCEITPPVTNLPDCPVVTAPLVTQTGPGQFALTFNFTGTGTNSANVIVYSGPVGASTPVLDTCIVLQGDGTIMFPFTNLLGATNVVLTPGTGNCNGGGGSICTPLTLVPGTGGGPLPVVFENFFAKRSGTSVNLTWKTLSEVNTKEFVIQRKTTSGYVDVRTVQASNNVNGSTYNAIDFNDTKSTSLYRIKVVDFDGTFRMSDTRTIKGLNGAADYIVFPNPATLGTKVTVSDISEVTDIQIIDMSGRMVSKQTLNNSNTLDLRGVNSGLYQIRIRPRTSNEVITRRLTVVN